jgi:hypothetical protein
VISTIQRAFLSFSLVLCASAPAAAAEAASTRLDLTGHAVGLVCLGIFVVAYIFVMAEEFTHMRKSKPVILAAGIMWGVIAFTYASHGLPHAAEEAFRHNFLEFAELFMFLLVAMTYINAMDERFVFEALRIRLVSAGFSFRQLFWITGILSFFISPIAAELCGVGLRQHRRRRQRRRRFQPLRRHHHSHGLAEGNRQVSDLLPSFRAVGRQLDRPRHRHELRGAQGKTISL